MHIAVLDENIADRKQLERLLDRESDRRIQTTGNLYIDSFGAVDSMFTALKQYDFFMIKTNGSAEDDLEIVKRLRSSEIMVPVCILRTKDEYDSLPEDVILLSKPVLVKELTDTIDKVYKLYEERGDIYKPAEPEDEEPEYEKNKSKLRKFFERFY